MPAREHLRGIRREIRDPDLLVADLPVEFAVRAEVGGVVSVERGGDGQR
ncbi:hypothetical protein JQN58_23960 [Aneurinibacillus sp. BA2021]|nr:hypothetical protein [Aneurinibacillus sp. BA2021]